MMKINQLVCGVFPRSNHPLFVFLSPSSPVPPVVIEHPRVKGEKRAKTQINRGTGWVAGIRFRYRDKSTAGKMVMVVVLVWCEMRHSKWVT